MVVATNGYANVPGAFASWFPPGVFSFRGAVAAVRNLASANAVAYDAVHRHDRRARVGPVHNMIAFTPADPASADDRAGARHADYIFNRVYLERGGAGSTTRTWTGVDPGERRRRCAGGPTSSDSTTTSGPRDGPRRAGERDPSRCSTSCPRTSTATRRARIAALPDALHGVRLGDLPRGPAPLVAHRRALRPAGLRHRERHRRRRR